MLYPTVIIDIRIKRGVTCKYALVWKITSNQFKEPIMTF